MKDLLNYKGKTVVVTGAASGMGAATAKLLIDQGAIVYALDIREPSYEGIEYIPVNLASKESIDHAISQLPDSIDSLFNCAGIPGVSYGGKAFNPIDVVTVNYIAPVYLTESLIPRMPENSSVAIIASIKGFDWMNRIEELQPLVQQSSFEDAQDWFNQNMNNLFKNSYLKAEANPSYALTKQAIILWMKQRAYSLSERKIRINTVSPGIVDTPMLKDFSALANKDLRKSSLISQVGRTATAEDQAMVLLFINSDLASYVSGIDLQVDYAATATTLYAFN